MFFFVSLWLIDLFLNKKKKKEIERGVVTLYAYLFSLSSFFLSFPLLSFSFFSLLRNGCHFAWVDSHLFQSEIFFTNVNILSFYNSFIYTFSIIFIHSFTKLCICYYSCNLFICANSTSPHFLPSLFYT